MVHFFVTSFTQMGLLLVLICWTTSSTGATFSLEEEFRQLKENYIQMKEVVKSLEAKDSQLKSLESKVIQLELTVTELKAKVQQQDSLLTSILREKNERTVATDCGSSLTSNNQNNQSTVAINGLPSSCGDLKMIGHIWSGIYSVMGSARMESVYCDFTKLPDDAGFQKLIGYVDVKSAPVHFYVQRSSSFNSTGIPIPFDLERVNKGNAMDLTTGIFTVPRSGTYFFAFTGTAEFSVSSSGNRLGVGLYLNGVRIGDNWVEGPSITVDRQLTTLTLQSTLNLKTGDQLWVQITGWSAAVKLLENGHHFTHFTGFMLEEEIVASL